MRILETRHVKGYDVTAVETTSLSHDDRRGGCAICEGHAMRLGICEHLPCEPEQRGDKRGPDVVFISPDRIALARLRGRLT